MGPLARLIKKIFGKKEEPKKDQLSVHQTKQVADAIKKADAGEFASSTKVAEIKNKWIELTMEVDIEYEKESAPSKPATLKEKVDIEYEKASAPVKAATPVAKATPAYQSKDTKKSSAYHRDDEDDDSFVRNSLYSAAAYSSDSYSSISDSSSSCSSDSYSSSSDSSSSSSCDSSSW